MDSVKHVAECSHEIIKNGEKFEILRQEIEEEVNAEHRLESATSFKRRSKSCSRIAKIAEYSSQLITGQEDETYYANEIDKIKNNSKSQTTIIAAGRRERDEKQITGDAFDDVTSKRSCKEQYQNILFHQNNMFQHACELSYHILNDYKKMEKDINRLKSQVGTINTRLKNDLSQELDKMFKNLTDLEISFQKFESSLDFSVEI